MSKYMHDNYSPSPVFYDESCVDETDDYVPTYGGVAVQQNSPTPEIDDYVVRSLFVILFQQLFPRFDPFFESVVCCL